MLRYVWVMVAACGLSACHQTANVMAGADAVTGAATHVNSATGSTQNSGPSLLLAPEDVVTLGIDNSDSGVAITGAIQPERRADLRAEVSAVVLQVLKDNGDQVHRGDLLVRLDDTAIRDGLNSAETSARAADLAYAQAQRQYERLSKLREAGMVSTQAVEDEEIKRDTAQSELEAAKARLVTARQQLDRTEARAPFDGIVSDRKVSAGDTAQIGKELVKVIDPHSMRFEGMVSADHVGEVQAGQDVMFRIHGYADRTFTGKVTRVNPATNASTRQVEVLVSFADNNSQFILAGLYAEGHVNTGSKSQLMIPASVVVKEGGQYYTWRIQTNILRKVSVSLGKSDERTGNFELNSGVSSGDIVLRHPEGKLVDGQKIEMTPSAPTAS